jgi:octaprenyl-diphosphate synthase
MMEMDKLVGLIGDDLVQVEAELKENLHCDVSLISKVGEYVLMSGGKRLRPVLLLLSSRLCGYQGGRQIPLASVLEFIHTATLLHDDVVDNAEIRRGNSSANSLWGNEASVLIGDYMYAKSFSVMVEHGDMRILDLLSSATTQMAQGEVLQLVKTGDIEATEEDYIDIVIKKTAVLISAACKTGAILGGVSREEEEALASYGMNLGIAFQLVDDSLDYTSQNEGFGKAIGIDLHEGKMTLPLIHLLRNADDLERNEVISLMERDVEIEEGDLRRVLELINRYKGIEYTIGKADGFIQNAKKNLEIFKDSEYKKALFTIADFVLKRET